MALLPSRVSKRALTALTLGALTAGTLALTPAAQANPDGTGLVISEAYGGGGNADATFTNDFVELYNPTDAPISVAGMSVQYRSATGTGVTGGVTPLTGSVPANGHYLVQQAQGTGGTTPLPEPDATGSIAMAAGAGVVFLATGTTAYTPAAGSVVGDARVVDLVGYGAANRYENLPGDAATAAPATSNTTAVTRDAARTDRDDNSADFATGAPAPQNTGGDPDPDPDPPTGECGDPATAIHDIQGSGTTFDPAFGGTRTIEGVATSAMAGLRGVWVQEESADADTDPLTSEGIFVFLAGRPAPAEGSVVRVTGDVTEFGGKTQMAELFALDDCGAAETPIQTTGVSFPLDAPGDLERYEGMLVELTDELVISEYFNYARFGEVVVAAPPNDWDRLHTPTAVAEPGAEANALAADYAKRIITIDDAATQQNPSVIPHPGNGAPFSLDNRFRGGDTITGIEGILDEAFNLYRLQPTEYGDFTTNNPRPETAPDVGGDVQVASFNVLNYFLTLNTAGNRCGPALVLECRGANDAEELERQRAKILAALAELDADVVGLMEMENSTGVEPAADLVQGLNDLLGAGTYDYIDTGVVGTDAIRLGFLYKPGTVTPAGDFAVLDSSVDPRFNDQKSRPMLTQTFDTVVSDDNRSERFTVSVNHLKSKGSDCNDVGDPDMGDGQANCNGTRTAAAEAIVDYLAEDPTSSGDPDQLIIGDLNSYDHEDPIRALEAGGFVDQVKLFGGEFAYGYVFDGQAGYLDHALANDSLAVQVTGTSEWHINADEPTILDYDTTFKPPAVDAIYAPDAYRSSDHDAVLVGLALDSPEPLPVTEMTVRIAPKRIEAGKTRPVVEARLSREDGERVDDGLVAVYNGDELLGALAVENGRVKIPLGVFREPGEFTLTVTYSGGSSDDATEDVAIVVEPKKGKGPKGD